ncbi:MAG: GTP-binding protein [Bacteroidota bacterium]
MTSNEKIPVHLITGFLGSGKTTFLNHFIQERLPERILVIENECGATNVDGGLIMEGVEEVLELSSGCLCCSLSDGLLDLLQMASEKRGQYDRIVIETTGIADPSSIMQVFLTDPRVDRFFQLEQVIALADAGYLEDWLVEAEEALRQIALADVILLNKADTVAPEYLPQLHTTIESINPHAFVFTGEQGRFPVEEVMQVGSTRPESVEIKTKSAEPQEHHHHHHPEPDEPGHAHVNNSHKITTFTLSFDRPFDLDSLSLELYRLANLYRDQVYRVKGILHIPNSPNRVILQSVRTTFVATDGSPWGPDESRQSKLVFIGRGLRKSIFENMFGRYQIQEA